MEPDDFFHGESFPFFGRRLQLCNSAGKFWRAIFHSSGLEFMKEPFDDLQLGMTDIFGCPV